MKIIYLILLFILTSCTLNFVVTHTQGQADDVVDNTPEITADVSASFEAPHL